MNVRAGYGAAKAMDIFEVAERSKAAVLKVA